MPRHCLSHADSLFVGNGDMPGYQNSQRGIEMTPLFWHNFGAPAAAVANGVCASQAINTGTNGLINGSLASGGVATMDVPRALVAAWTNTAVMTIKGTDQYGNAMTEVSASGTSHTGKKAFKTVTQVTVSANVTGATVGTGDVLGLPFRVAANGLVAARANSAIDAGVQVAADTTSPATGTTGDVRGTFDPAVALNGSNTVAVLIKPHSLVDREGSFGVAQFTS